MPVPLTVLIADIAPLVSPSVWKTVYQELPDRRKEAVDRLRLDRDKYLSAGAFYLLKILWTRFFPGREMPQVSCDEMGKPYFPEESGVHFNLSHSGTKVMCVLSDGPVGCDLEERKKANEKIASRFFSEKEKESLDRIPEGPPRENAFLDLWSLKESYVKAWGKGLRCPLSSFTVRAEDRPVLADCPGDYPRAEFWKITIEGYAGAVCRLGDRKDGPTVDSFSFSSVNG